MSRKEQKAKSSGLAVIALMLGAAGFTLGALSFISVLTGEFDGADGVDATLNPNIYYCASGAEVRIFHL